ncbi:MAG TPA: cytochrome c peroxidase [Longimicrobiaceae bacterium]|nr:cytochrome c peroxidase [Longimicrobiaceae bacterium]
MILSALAACSEAPVELDLPEDSLLRRALAAGLKPIPEDPIYPTDNPYQPDRVELGHLLFFDPILSGPQNVACSTCHLPRFAFGDGRQFPAGAGATGLGPDRTDPEPAPLRLMPRNSPPMFNLGIHGNMSPVPSESATMFWGAGAFGLEGQVLGPIAAESELRGVSYPRAVALDSVIARLRANDEYLDRFADAYPRRVDNHGRDPSRLITQTTLERAIAAYLRELLTPNAPIDRFLKGDEGALSEREKAGLELFIGDANCVSCHMGPELSDFSMHVLGTRQEGLGRDTTPGDDLGWGEHGGTPYAFRTAPLRQVAESAPYFHAGTAETLRDVLEFKNQGLSRYSRVTADMLDPKVVPLELSDAEISDLIAFLGALTDTITIKGPLYLAPDRVPSGLKIPK